MAKTSVVLIPPNYDISYKKALVQSERFFNPTVRFKRAFTPRKRLPGISQKSLAVQYAPDWNGFSGLVQNAWNTAATYSHMSGFKLFIQDLSKRIKAGLSGFATPSNFYQSMVGKLDFSGGAVDTLLTQLHPLNYYVSRKVTGTKDQYEPKYITESFDLPITVGLSYKAQFTTGGGGSFLKFYAEVLSNYQGLDIKTPCEIVLVSGAGWQTVTANLTKVPGKVRGYNLYLWAKGVTGKLWFDNVIASHSGHNWARDPYCNHVNTAFTKGFYQVIKHWAFVRVDSGIQFKSVYNQDSL